MRLPIASLLTRPQRPNTAPETPKVHWVEAIVAGARTLMRKESVNNFDDDCVRRDDGDMSGTAGGGLWCHAIVASGATAL